MLTDKVHEYNEWSPKISHLKAKICHSHYHLTTGYHGGTVCKAVQAPLESQVPGNSECFKLRPLKAVKLSFSYTQSVKLSI